MKNWKEKQIKKVEKQNSKIIRHFIIGVSVIAVIVHVVVFLHPFCFFSPMFISKGDNFLLDRHYSLARLQYEKALIINPWDAKAQARIELVDKAKKDILALTDFYKEKNDHSMLEKIELATSVPENETEALKISRQFIDEGDFQLALLPAETALEMDPQYKEAQEFVRIIKEQL